MVRSKLPASWADSGVPGDVDVTCFTCLLIGVPGRLFSGLINAFPADECNGKAPCMIRLTRLNHVPLVLNSDLIEHVEVTPDTVITLTTGQKLMVLESAEEITNRVIAFRQAILSGAACPHARVGSACDTAADRQSEPHPIVHG
jgi:flagellar protein FlbD